ncbi:P-loop containing nucleoside triphosphate hydrolase protein [Amylocystis lapponica]|nr:P-loop containing nucleoside triphosphate hydrolase protein [Amylocystis lapponica]
MASSAALTTTHLPQLRAELDGWRQKQESPNPGFTTSISDIALVRESETHSKDVVVAFRTRPPLENEIDRFQSPATASSDKPTDSQGEQADVSKVEFCAGITVTASEPGEFVAHVPGLKWNGPTLTHKTFVADLAFGPDIANEEVYQRTVAANEIITLALSGGTACVLAYGQTGSGKTYTMEALEHRIARDLFAVAQVIGKRLREAGLQGTPEGTASTGSGVDTDVDVFEFSATFLELLGKRAVDLLEPAEDIPVDAQGNVVRKEVVVQENKNGEVRPRLISTVFKSSDELEALIVSALAHRRTSATARNATSSRSHAVLTIWVKNKLLPYADDGQLLLVDLAGSERYEDSKLHDKQRMDESRENNKSLMNLKECVRAKAKMASEDGFVHIPWRSNKLTMLLKSIFDPESRQASRTLIIAHVSPHIQDSAHSVSTLAYAAPFRTSVPKPRGPAPYDAADPRTWDHAHTVAWLTTEYTKRAQARAAHQHDLRAKEAEKDGKELPPLDPDVPVAPAVDVEQLCPEATTALHLARLYTTEFVRRGLAAANVRDGTPQDVVRNTTAEVAGQLSYLVLTAKTKKRTAVMKSRKRLDVEAHYGAWPVYVVPSTGPGVPDITVPGDPGLRKYTNEEIRAAVTTYGSRWSEMLDAAGAATDADKADEAKVDAMLAMFAAWKAGEIHPMD